MMIAMLIATIMMMTLLVTMIMDDIGSNDDGDTDCNDDDNHDDQRDDGNDDVVQFNIKGWKLTIGDLLPDDNGKYTCVISNQHGSINWTYTVEVMRECTFHTSLNKAARGLSLRRRPFGTVL